MLQRLQLKRPKQISAQYPKQSTVPLRHLEAAVQLPRPQPHQTAEVRLKHRPVTQVCYPSSKVIDTIIGGGGLSGGAIGGIVGGVIGGILLLGIAGFLLYKNKAKRNQVLPTVGPSYRGEYDQGNNQPEPKPVMAEQTQPAIRYPDPDAVVNQEESGPVGGRLRYPE